MSDFGSYAANAPAFGFGTAGFDRAAPVSHRVDDASEPFGRVESTQQCFARNGEAATRSKWTPPEPPSRPLFQSSPSVFYSNTGDSKPCTSLFGDSAPHQSGSLFGSSRSSQTTLTGGVTFGCTSSNPSFGGDMNSTKTSGVFGTSHSRSSRMAFGFGGSTTKPPPSSNPFAAPTSNPFTKTATKSADFSFGGSTTTQFGSSTRNLLAAKNVPGNPFAMKPSSTVNPFSAKVAPNATVNPFAARVAPNAPVSSFPPPTPSTDFFAAPGSAWSTGWSTVSGMPCRSASTKFKSGLRAPLKPRASPWSLGTKPVEQTQPASFPRFDWGCWKKSKESTQPSAENSFKMLNASSSEAASNSHSTISSSSVVSKTTTCTALVASPDTNPYGSGSFGAGLLEQKVKTAIANPPSSIELKVFDARTSSVSSSSVPRLQPPSARFASRLGLARQPLQALPMRPVQPRFPSRRMPVASSPVRAKQADVFRFSSSFSRLAISKKSLRIRGKPSTTPMNATTSSPRKAKPLDGEVDTQTPVLSDVKSDDASSSHSNDDEVGDHDDEGSPSACPVLLNEEYFTEPSVGDMQQLTEEELASVENFTIGRHGYGKISFIGATDVRGLQLDNLVIFSDGEVVVYPGDDAKPEVGCAFNKPAVVDLHGISAEVNESHEAFLKRLETHTQALGATFLGYVEGSQAGNGVWSFRVEHF